jgi:hypothetical protein
MSNAAGKKAQREQVRAAYEQWIAAVTSGGPGPVLELYDRQAVLLPTLACGPNQGTEAIAQYFGHFTKNRRFF